MRTTLDIDDAVLAAAKALARDMSTSIGAALSVLALRGLTSAAATTQENGFPVFARVPGAVPITLEAVNAHRDG